MLEVSYQVRTDQSNWYITYATFWFGLMIWAKQKLKTEIIYKILQKYKRKLSYESNNESIKISNQIKKSTGKIQVYIWFHNIDYQINSNFSMIPIICETSAYLQRLSIKSIKLSRWSLLKKMRIVWPSVGSFHRKFDRKWVGKS